MERKIFDVLEHHTIIEGGVVLDAGGGTGNFAERLLEEGAEKVYLYDHSAEMLSIATTRLAKFGNCAVVWQAGLEDEIRLEDGTVDCILCIQALHYIEDWNVTAAEFFRVLKDGGCVVVVTTHPAADSVFRGIGPYFEHEKRKAFLTSGGKLWPIMFWHRPLEAILVPFLSAGFVIADIREPYLDISQSHPWWDITGLLFRHFPPYLIFALRK
ncbi:MAG: class I SAM-dependent methyltransferase [Anaerolineae bacterium]|nr:class I SAM-dependent methyltransferase [Anaerolineae bacterium]